MSVRMNWNGDAVLDTMRQRSAKVLRLVAQSIVANVQSQLIPGHGELSGDLKKSYGFSLDQDEVNPLQSPAVDAIEKSLRLFVGSQWAYSFKNRSGLWELQRIQSTPTSLRRNLRRYQLDNQTGEQECLI